MGKRRKFQGALNILSFNRHFYFIGIGILILLFVSRLFIEWPNTIFWIIIAAFIYGLLMPLIVSAYVYDFSGYYNFQWLKKVVTEPGKINSITNVNAGFDETSFILEENFPNAKLRVFDFYDAKRHTEPAIKRARKVSLVYPSTQSIQANSIPLNERSVDFIFLLSVVHEIRSHNEKIEFLKECYRVCKPNGSVIMVEHLRDFPNFVAFSVGFTHFFQDRFGKMLLKALALLLSRKQNLLPLCPFLNVVLNC